MIFSESQDVLHEGNCPENEDQDSNPRKMTFKRVRWSAEENRILSISFKSYLSGEASILSSADLKAVKCSYKCFENRTIPQIRSKLNNIKLGKSRLK